MTTAFDFPLAVVVFTMCHDLEDEHLVARKQHPCYEPILVATDVEHDTIANVTCGNKTLLDVTPTVPVDGPMTDVAVLTFLANFSSHPTFLGFLGEMGA